MKRILLFLFLLLIFHNQALAIEETSSKQELYLSDCIRLAVEKSLAIKKAKLNLQAASTDVKIAKANYAPAFSANVGYWQGFNTEVRYDDGRTKRFLPTVGVYLDQLIFDFGKTSANVDMQKFYQIAAQYAYFDTISKIANNVKLRYFAALEAKSIVEIEENNLNISKKILETTKKLYEENKKDKIDFINAEVYLSSAEMNLINAQNNYNKAMADLANIMEMEVDEEFSIKPIDTFDYYEAYFAPEFILAPKGTWHKITKRERQTDPIGEVQNLPFSLEYALETANKNNLELKVLNHTLDAVKKSALSVKRQFYPNFKGRVGYEFGSKYMESVEDTYTNNQLNVALTADTGINPMKYANELGKINLQVQMVENDIEAFKADLLFEVKKCYLDVETAQKQINAAKNKVMRARDNLQIASEDYSNNKLGYLEFQSARQNYNSSKIQYINELNAYNVALSKLERATYIFEDNFMKLLYDGLTDKEKELLNF